MSAREHLHTHPSLRLYQERSIEMLRESLAAGHRRPVLQLPTGAGKTRIAAAIIQLALAKGRRAIFVVPRLSLIEQTITSFEKVGLTDIGVVQAQHHRTNAGASVQVASAQTLMRREIPPAGLVIVDECHLQFDSIAAWMASAEWASTPFIGLTATPWAKGMGVNYDDMLCPVSIQGLIDEGYLSPFRVFAPPAPDLSDVRIIAGEFNEADLSKACDKQELIADIVGTWLEKGEDRPTLCYGVDRAHAKRLQDRFLEAGVAAEYIDCETQIPVREEIFGRFREGAVRLICNVATLDRGIDLDVRCIIDARPTKSRIRFCQTIGRGLRVADGKTDLKILDHSGNHLRLGLITSLGNSKLDDGESGPSYDKEAKKAPEIRLCHECRSVLAPLAMRCSECGAVCRTPPVVEKRGELIELDARTFAKATDNLRAEKSVWYIELLKIAQQKGYKRGWAAHKYQERFGVWPRSIGLSECEPTPETIAGIRAWVRARQAEYASQQASLLHDEAMSEARR